MADVKRFNSKNGIENGAQESNLSMSDILISQHITGDNNDYKLTLAQAQAIPYGVCESLGDEDKTVNLINYPSTYTAQVGNKVLIKFIHANTKGHVSDNTYPTLTVGGVTKPIAAQGKTIGAGAIVDDQIIELVLTPDYWNIDQNIREVTSAYTILTDGSYIYNKTQIDNNNYTKAQTDSAINGALANYDKIAQEIANGTDLDNVKKEGWYFCKDNTSANTITNKPSGFDFSFGLRVIKAKQDASGNIRQIFYPESSIGILERIYANGSWGSWEKIATESDITVGNTVTNIQTLATSGEIYSITIPEDGYYYLCAINTDVSGACGVYITKNNASQYIQASDSGQGTYKRATTGVIPFKKGTVIEVRAFFTNSANFYRLS